MTLEALAHNLLSGDAFAEVFIKDHRNLLTKFDTVLRFVPRVSAASAYSDAISLESIFLLLNHGN